MPFLEDLDIGLQRFKKSIDWSMGVKTTAEDIKNSRLYRQHLLNQDKYSVDKLSAERREEGTKTSRRKKFAETAKQLLIEDLDSVADADLIGTIETLPDDMTSEEYNQYQKRVDKRKEKATVKRTADALRNIVKEDDELPERLKTRVFHLLDAGTPEQIKAAETLYTKYVPPKAEKEKPEKEIRSPSEGLAVVKAQEERDIGNKVDRLNMLENPKTADQQEMSNDAKTSGELEKLRQEISDYRQQHGLFETAESLRVGTGRFSPGAKEPSLPVVPSPVVKSPGGVSHPVLDKMLKDGVTKQQILDDYDQNSTEYESQGITRAMIEAL